MRAGLLLELISETGELPTEDIYDHLSYVRSEQGAEWSRITGLAAHYGAWTAALRAATDVAFAQTPGRIRAETPDPGLGIPIRGQKSSRR